MDKQMIACLLLLLASCNPGRQTDENTDIQYKGDTIYVAANAAVNTRLTLYAVAQQDYSTGFTATGAVKAIAGQMAGIAPPFDGRITQSFVSLGQRIPAGAPIFELHSPAFSEVVKSYYQALQAKKMAQSNLRRRKDLVANGVGIARELEEAETEYELAFREYETAEANLKTLHINPAEASPSQALHVTSPIAGEVVQTNMVIGQYVKSDDPPLAIVADLSNVWVAAQVKEPDVATISPNDIVNIYTNTNPDHPIAGRVSHISQLLDEETRTVQVLITCANKDRLLKPGMYVSAYFAHPPEASIIIPSNALLQKDKYSYVLIEVDKDVYLRQEVWATQIGDEDSLIRGGLEDGDVIVSEGGIYLIPN
jgi:cobalt-zinc-cadmium efflux system membrane fusion protein